MIHVDFERVDLDERVTVKIPLRLKGDAPGLNTAGAILLHPVTELEIECTVGNLEESISVDISELKAGDSIHASDLDLPHQYKLLSDPDAVVAGIVIKSESEDDRRGRRGRRRDGGPRGHHRAQEDGAEKSENEADRRTGQPGRRVRAHTAQRRLHGGRSS